MPLIEKVCFGLLIRTRLIYNHKHIDRSAPHRPRLQNFSRPLGAHLLKLLLQSAKMASSGTVEEGDRWHGREEEATKPARDPGPACDTSKAWSPLDLF